MGQLLGIVGKTRFCPIKDLGWVGLARLQNNGPMMLFNRNMKLLRFSSDDPTTRPAAASFNSDKMEIHQIPGSR